MAAVNIYLNFDGNCEKAFLFYQSIFGGEFPYMGRFSDMPEEEGMPPIDEAMKHLIMHVSLPISPETQLMGSDVLPNPENPFVAGNNFAISVNTNSRSEADEIFSKLSVGGTITMPLEDTFWEAYFGMLTDAFGINWMINFDE